MQPISFVRGGHATSDEGTLTKRPLRLAVLLPPRRGQHPRSLCQGHRGSRNRGWLAACRHLICVDNLDVGHDEETQSSRISTLQVLVWRSPFQPSFNILEAWSSRCVWPRPGKGVN
ncbi:hypothetical protein LIA77_01383 [Sarocladium implicatum]|nr:hypothetical protein LIA77_01383 [Sarocladium implicatum]